MKENNQTQISAHIKMKKDIMKNSFTSKLTNNFSIFRPRKYCCNFFNFLSSALNLENELRYVNITNENNNFYHIVTKMMNKKYQN